MSYNAEAKHADFHMHSLVFLSSFCSLRTLRLDVILMIYVQFVLVYLFLFLTIIHHPVLNFQFQLALLYTINPDIDIDWYVLFLFVVPQR